MVKSSDKFWRRFAFLFKSILPAVHKNTKRRHSPIKSTSLRFETRLFIMLAMCFVLYFIAGNIGSGWIYLLSASLITAIAVGFVVPLWQMSLINTRQEAPNQSVAGQQATVSIALSTKYNQPVHWLRISYEFDTGPMAKSTIANSQPPLFLDQLSKKQTLSWITEPLIRGVHKLGTVVVASSFPLGLVWCYGKFSAAKSQTITVYPEVVPVNGSFLFRLRASTGTRADLARSNQSVRQSTSTRGIREYVRGDSPRHVHWASSARTGRLLVREFEAEGLPAFDVMLDLSAYWIDKEQFELAVVTAASLLTLGHKLGIDPQLKLNPKRPEDELSLPATAPGIARQMEILARVEPITNPPLQKEFQEDHFNSKSLDRVLIVIQPRTNKTISSQNRYVIEVEESKATTLSTLVNTNSLAGMSMLKSVIASKEDLTEL